MATRTNEYLDISFYNNSTENKTLEFISNRDLSIFQNGTDYTCNVARFSIDSDKIPCFVARLEDPIKPLKPLDGYTEVGYINRKTEANKLNCMNLQMMVEYENTSTNDKDYAIGNVLWSPEDNLTSTTRSLEPTQYLTERYYHAYSSVHFLQLISNTLNQCIGRLEPFFQPATPPSALSPVADNVYGTFTTHIVNNLAQLRQWLSPATPLTGYHLVDIQSDINVPDIYPIEVYQNNVKITSTNGKKVSSSTGLICLFRIWANNVFFENLKLEYLRSDNAYASRISLYSGGVPILVDHCFSNLECANVMIMDNVSNFVMKSCNFVSYFHHITTCPTPLRMWNKDYDDPWLWNYTEIGSTVAPDGTRTWNAPPRVSIGHRPTPQYIKIENCKFFQLNIPSSQPQTLLLFTFIPDLTPSQEAEILSRMALAGSASLTQASGSVVLSCIHLRGGRHITIKDCRTNEGNRNFITFEKRFDIYREANNEMEYINFSRTITDSNDSYFSYIESWTTTQYPFEDNDFVFDYDGPVVLTGNYQGLRIDDDIDTNSLGSTQLNKFMSINYPFDSDKNVQMYLSNNKFRTTNGFITFEDNTVSAPVFQGIAYINMNTNVYYTDVFGANGLGFITYKATNGLHYTNTEITQFYLGSTNNTTDNLKANIKPFKWTKKYITYYDNEHIGAPFNVVMDHIPNVVNPTFVSQFAKIDDKYALCLPTDLIDTANVSIRIIFNHELRRMFGFHFLPHESGVGHILAFNKNLTSKVLLGVSAKDYYSIHEGFSSSHIFPWTSLGFVSHDLEMAETLVSNNVEQFLRGSSATLVDYTFDVSNVDTFYNKIKFDAVHYDRKITLFIENNDFRRRVVIVPYLETADKIRVPIYIEPQGQANILLLFQSS